MTILKIDSIILCDWILKHYGTMSHLKLQKLLFYCDSYHLAYFDEELVYDKFEAWCHGPISRKIFNCFENQSVLYADLSFSSRFDVDNEFSKLSSEQRSFIVEVLDELTKWSSFELESAILNELPWIEACKREDSNVEISKETSRIFYKRQLSA